MNGATVFADDISGTGFEFLNGADNRIRNTTSNARLFLDAAVNAGLVLQNSGITKHSLEYSNSNSLDLNYLMGLDLVIKFYSETLERLIF